MASIDKEMMDERTRDDEAEHDGRLQVNPSVLRYEIGPDSLGGAAIRPLRSTVSQTEGCRSTGEAR